MSFIVGLSIQFNWDAIGSIASAVATLAALITIILSIKNDKDGSDGKQLAVQPWFHVSRFSRKGSGDNTRIQLVVQNDASPHITIDKVIFKVNGVAAIRELSFRYFKDTTNVTGKTFLIDLSPGNFFGKSAYIEIHYKNLYKRNMIAISPKFFFFDRVDETSAIYIKDEGFLYVPFTNEIMD